MTKSKSKTSATTAASTTAPVKVHNNTPYDDACYARVRDHVRIRGQEARGTILRTDASPEALWNSWLLNIPPEKRQHYNCHCCRRFIQKYGGLVLVNPNGTDEPLFWKMPESTDFGILRASVETLYELVLYADVSGVFYPRPDRVLGVASGPGLMNGFGEYWTHLHSSLHESCAHGSRLLNWSQAEAAKKEDFRCLTEALGVYDKKTVETAVHLLEHETLYRGEKVLGAAQWLLKVITGIDSLPSVGNRRNNFLWTKVARALPGYCTPKSGMIGTLLDDIKSGMSFETFAARFKAKMAPNQYMRPQAPPSAGNGAAAEKAVETLGISQSLKRRFARLDEVTQAWAPKTAAPVLSGVFAGVPVKGYSKSSGNNMVIPETAITWRKFSETVLPGAVSVKLKVPYGLKPFVALTTAQDPDAPPIIKWDDPANRNPVAWYVWTGGSLASQWGLTAGSHVEVLKISRSPVTWGVGTKSTYGYPESVILYLQGAADTKNTSSALFPEFLLSDLDGVRASIEAYSKIHKLEVPEGPLACGILLESRSLSRQTEIRVSVDTGAGVEAQYAIDRWE